MRTLNRIYAFILGYFWLPCPKCGREFGGHEIGRQSYVTWTLARGMVTRVCCRKCDK